jgi:tetratricopeptide (TPR) repeat protein
MFKRANIVLLTFLLFSFWNFSHAQENLEDSALNENKSEDYFYEAVAQRGIENYDKAIISIQKALELEPKNAAFQFELGKNYLSLKEYTAAEIAFKSAIEIDKKQRWYWNGLYDVYYQTKDFQKSIPVVEKLIEFDPNMREDLVSLFMNTNQKDKALQLIKEIEATSNLTKTMEFYKLKLESTAEFATPKKEQLEKGIKEHPKYEQNYVDLISLYLSFNQEEKAFEIAKQLEKEIPNSDWAHVSLVKFYLASNDGINASKSMFKVLMNSKIDLKIKHRVFNEFLIFAVKNPTFFTDVDAAIPYFDNDPEIAVAREVAKFFLKKNDLERAAYYFEKAINKNKEDSESIAFYLEVLQQKLDYQRLVTTASDLLELYPTQASYYFYAGFGYNQLQNFKKAKEYLENGLDFVVENKSLEAKLYQQLIISCDNLKDATKKQLYSTKLKQLN